MNAAKRELLEIWIGAAIIAVLVLVVALVFGPTPFQSGSYEITARFNRADGIAAGSPVHAAGVPVGQIESLELDKNFRAVARMRIHSGVVLDSDATASIVTEGLFGGKFVSLDIGGGDSTIGDGEEISFTEDSLVLDDLLDLIVSRARQARPASDAAAPEIQP